MRDSNGDFNIADDALVARHISVAPCQPPCTCDCLHVRLHDERGVIVASATVPPQIAMTFLEAVADAVHTITERRQLRAADPIGHA